MFPIQYFLKSDMKYDGGIRNSKERIVSRESEKWKC